MTGTTIILSSLMKRSPKNLELSTKGFTELGKNPSTIPYQGSQHEPHKNTLKEIGLEIPIKNPSLSRFCLSHSILQFCAILHHKSEAVGYYHPPIMLLLDTNKMTNNRVNTEF